MKFPSYMLERFLKALFHKDLSIIFRGYYISKIMEREIDNVRRLQENCLLENCQNHVTGTPSIIITVEVDELPKLAEIYLFREFVNKRLEAI